MSKQAFALIAAVLAAGLFVAGCGSDDDATADEAPALTKAAFVKQADKICAASQERVAGKGSKLLEEEAKDFENEVIEVAVAPEYQTLADHVDELGVPSGDEAEVEAMVDAMHQRADMVTEDPQGFLTAKGAELNKYRQALKLAREYGLKECSQP